jgi:hypothetical protein
VTSITGRKGAADAEAGTRGVCATTLNVRGVVAAAGRQRPIGADVGKRVKNIPGAQNCSADEFMDTMGMFALPYL